MDKLSTQSIQTKKDQNWTKNTKNEYLPNMRPYRIAKYFLGHKVNHFAKRKKKQTNKQTKKQNKKQKKTTLPKKVKSSDHYICVFRDNILHSALYKIKPS